MSNGSNQSESGDNGANGAPEEFADGRNRVNRWLSSANARMRERRGTALTAALAGVLIGAGSVYLTLATDWDGPSEEENACASYIQGTIAWDDEGSTRWDASWLRRMCEGTTRPAQPGLCFDGVFNVPLEAGREIQEDWKDAVALCAGTSNAQERISCYQRKVADGLHFRDAIEACNPPPVIAGRNACERLVQDNIAVNRSGDPQAGATDGGDTTWTPRQLDLLCAETTRPSQPLLCFDRLFHGRGPWDEMINGRWRRAARLCSGTNSARQITRCVSDALASREDQKPSSAPQVLDPDERPKPPPSDDERLFAAVLQACNPPQRTSAPSDRCKRYVQGNIPWSSKGYRDWQPEVLDALCADTRSPQEPGLCFFRAMNGAIGEERGGLSKWAYAVRLCSGTNDAGARLACYDRARSEGKDGRAAINACKGGGED